MNNPSINSIIKMDRRMWDIVPDRKTLKPDGDSGIAIGNITAQYGSNVYLNNFDHYCIETLGFNEYVRYVDDIIILSKDKSKLSNALPYMEKKLNEAKLKINKRKTIIDTVYHGIKFLGKVSYPYGYQKPKKESAGRCMKSAREVIIDENLLSRLNSQMGRFRHYASFNLMNDYIATLPKEVWEYVTFDYSNNKFVKGENYGRLWN